MQFTSVTFLLLFLSPVLVFYQWVPYRFKSAFIFAVSLIFVAWARVTYVPVLLASVFINRELGRLVYRCSGRKFWLRISVVFNLLFLFGFKYSGFFTKNLNVILSAAGIHSLPVPEFVLPLGVSFYTFRVISYQIDLSRKKIPEPAGFIGLFNYMAFFPQVSAGPIVRYSSFTLDPLRGSVLNPLFVKGIRRFVYGLIKKALLANTLGVFADAFYALPNGHYGAALSWLGVVSYALQVYVDFSAYTDMAIGLSQCLGYRAPENFNFPYRAKSARDFWNRWHMSLTNWFRDYLFLPLAFSLSRRIPGKRMLGIKSDLFIYLVSVSVTWMLVGFWHGAGWTFIGWGLWFAFFLGVEQAGFKKLLKKWPRPLQHGYLLLIVLISWVLFRAESLSQVKEIFKTLTGFWSEETTFDYYRYLTPYFISVFIISIAGASGILNFIRKTIIKYILFNTSRKILLIYKSTEAIVLLLLFIFALSELLKGGFNPFIYVTF